ncbi:trypsin-like peptidase domain-containing protein [Cohnella xylanilytica]|uniref:Trypsin-like peptidase domain-containing protein n=1 Tax=Cohnella xylanilytica TaxID=557555 RepID=A0A841UA28_9BACL|nr:trypsin-like peptidase domain-containing protein [Cohnella xylanilytica]MBB6695093.1 trypsin-like peptidase domain-containing protein [Cohnella xylanilytica]
MSFFDDDFYSTRVKRRTRRNSGFRPNDGRGFRQGSVFRVALLSSLASSLLVAIVFTLLVNRPAAPSARPVTAGDQSIVETSERTITAAAKIRPAVVSVINRQKLAGGRSDDAESGSLENASLGSGVIFEKKDGKARIVTNAHVVANAGSVEIAMVNGGTKEAKIVGSDAITDLAVLEVDAKGIDTVASIGKSSRLREGETVIAVGNPLGLSDSLTDGIVSNLKRIIPISLNQDGNYDWEEEVIQISAPINSGNSGGALVNLDGEVVGINSMKVLDMGVEGIGFAIPIDDAMPVVRELIERGKVLRPYLGIYTMDLGSYLDGLEMQDDGGFDGGFGGGGDGEEDGTDSGTDSGSAPDEAPDGEDVPPVVVPEGVEKGVLVLEAVGPAKEAGLKLNDIIVKLDGKPIGSMMELRKYLYNSKKIGESLTITYYRDGKQSELSVKLAEKSEDNE